MFMFCLGREIILDVSVCEREREFRLREREGVLLPFDLNKGVFIICFLICLGKERWHRLSTPTDC